jgi:hypothetical protein
MTWGKIIDRMNNDINTLKTAISQYTLEGKDTTELVRLLKKAEKDLSELYEYELEGPEFDDHDL